MGRSIGAVSERTDERRGLHPAWRRGRRVALVCAAVWCVVLGIGMTAVIVDRGSLGQTATTTLLAAVAMLVLPGLTAVALRIDAREQRMQAHVANKSGRPPRAIAHRSRPALQPRAHTQTNRPRGQNAA